MIRRSKITTQQIVQEFQNVHNEKYNYSLVEYNTMHTKVKILCPIHGEFEQTPNAHIRQKQGCRKCSTLLNSNSQKSNTLDFIKKAKEIHQNEYDYSKVRYGKNAHEKVEVICKEHGSFHVSPNNHLSKKSKCSFCMKRHTGWTKTSWKTSCKGKIAKLYIIKCYNNKETFYKIGITNKETIKQRFYHKSLMPYNYSIIKIIESKEDPIYIYDLERNLHKLHRNVKYKPLIKFAGDTECFSEIFINSQIH